eukprot:CAMPEP_0197655976 /NCGR_PEP_ID=MMETSP1338-20131121/39791_1 /TAXON_ID=43686 ORGANISM="Pelagodinium beii, Strain RCC1491" /NCGR_SAMPLE_ID=MMETSP1338 /ASSEMBLY_ACC=CAM_ASM_000754 /LENGTH=204 /DNA_ID=CAMNT_0043231745 /DNA_START=65 /DNA_END=679 /DNA_ORIENTATION=-
MTVLGKSPCFVAKDNVTMRTAVCGMVLGLLINSVLWCWVVKAIQDAEEQVKHPSAACVQEAKYLKATVALTMATSVISLLLRIMGARKCCTCLVCWLDFLMTSLVLVAFAEGALLTFGGGSGVALEMGRFSLRNYYVEDFEPCQQLHVVSFWYYLSFIAISLIMLIPALTVVCCVGSAHARELDDENYTKLLDPELDMPAAAER